MGCCQFPRRAPPAAAGPVDCACLTVPEDLAVPLDEGQVVGAMVENDGRLYRFDRRPQA